MKVYLAAAYERHEEMRGVRDVLQALGHEITSSWIDRAMEVPAGTTANLDTDPARYAEYAQADLADLDAADTVVSFTGGGRGGRHTEFGYALAHGKRLVLAGPREHVFHTLAGEWYPDWPQLAMAWSAPAAREANELAPDQAALLDLLREANAQSDPEHPHGYWEAGDYP